nr:immunoglobulin heavy chain junction region [Macaca mulatta]MOX66000.1 immunoglobulin heavy chain junction region [Macaca mulatta]MOX67653.1 immunoglobulin heavy chain junction region [Macaca mulatta]
CARYEEGGTTFDYW